MGLSSSEVRAKVKQGKVNDYKIKDSNSIGRIIARNLFTIFNLVNIILALMVFSVGSYKNLLFIFIAIANTLIAIINEIRAKKTVDKMKLLAEQNPTVIRDEKPIQISPKEIVEGDLMILGIGDQILVDSIVEEGIIEVNESFITGEANNIKKQPGDKLTSGSFIVSGSCKATVTSVGADNYISKLESTAHTIKTENSKLFTIMNNIVKYISIVLIPIGALLLWSRFRVDGDTPAIAVTSTVAALINMIPEGLILLTSSVLALSTIRLSRKKVLVQDLYSIETLARVDCIALDKTGTLTTGKMTVKDIVPAKGVTENALYNTLALILSHSTADTSTSLALKEKVLKGAKFKVSEEVKEVISFSSDRKCSGVRTKTATYLMGAPEFITDKKIEVEGDYRVVAVVKDKKLLGYATLEDDLRKDAKNIIDYFYKNDVDIKIISGDNQKTVEKIALASGMKDIKSVDLSDQSSSINYDKLVKDYNIFTRVKPTEKKSLIKALKKQGKTVAMTGDGVNDILAMKEADCSISIGEGSDAARRSSKLVLLDNDFAAVPSIIDEGRRTINNLERSTALFLAKTVYASILAVLFVFLPLKYPFTPIEMTLLNFTCIGFPAFILALENNTERIKNRFAKNIMHYSVPIGLTVTITTLILSILAKTNGLTHSELTTASVLVTFTIDLILIYWISKPLNPLRMTLFLTIIGIVVAVFLIPFVRNFFEFTLLNENALIITVSVTAFGTLVFFIIRYLMGRILAHVIKSRQELDL